MLPLLISIWAEPCSVSCYSLVSLLTLPNPLTIPQVGGRPTQTTFFDLLNHSSSLVHPVRHHDVHHHDVHDSIKLPPLK